jgi:hypothetical protein
LGTFKEGDSRKTADSRKNADSRKTVSGLGQEYRRVTRLYQDRAKITKELQDCIRTELRSPRVTRLYIRTELRVPKNDKKVSGLH